MKVLVTGGNGLTGRYIVRRLAQEHQVEVLDHRVIEQAGVVTHQADVLDLPRVKALMEGCEAVVHLAAIPHPLENPPEEVFRTNVMGTFNVLEASASNGVGRLVFMSSESVLGFAFSSGAVKPEYLPIDEGHPLRPIDPYGLSKGVGESLCAAYSRRSSMTTICLRPPWIWVPEEAEVRIYRELLRHPEAWPQTLWAYVHVWDVAEAVASAVGRPLPAGLCGTCFLGAAENWTGRESRELAREFYPRARLAEPARTGPYSLLSLERARELIAYQPTYSLRDLPGLEDLLSPTM
jgi:UDP-glucose 4-epimerase